MISQADTNEPLPSVDQMLEDVYRWTLDKSDSLFGRYVDDDRQRKTYRVPDQILAQRHPLLPQVIRALHDFNSEKRGDTYAPGASVNLSLFYLESGTMRLPGVALGEYHDFASINELDVWEHEKDTITVKGLELTVLTVTKDGVSIPFVAADTILRATVRRQDLDRDFPGWHERFSIGLELGLIAPDLARYMFTNDPTPAIALTMPTGVAFD